MTTSNRKDSKIRLVVEVSPDRIMCIKVLANILGKPQHEVVTRAVEDYVDKHRSVVDNFMNVRRQVEAQFKEEQKAVRELDRQRSEAEFTPAAEIQAMS